MCVRALARLFVVLVVRPVMLPIVRPLLAPALAEHALAVESVESGALEAAIAEVAAGMGL